MTIPLILRPIGVLASQDRPSIYTWTKIQQDCLPGEKINIVICKQFAVYLANMANWITTKKIGGRYTTSTWSHQKYCFQSGGWSQAPEKAFRRYLTRSSPQCFASFWYLNTLDVILVHPNHPIYARFEECRIEQSYFNTSVAMLANLEGGLSPEPSRTRETKKRWCPPEL